VANEDVLNAWDILCKTVYTVPPDKYKRDGAESILQARPTFDSSTRWVNTKLNYNAKDLLPAWDGMIKGIEDCKKSDGFRFDLVDLTRQVLANYASPLQQKFVRAYQQNDTIAFKQFSNQFIALMDDMDKLLATRKDFLLGPWIVDARQWGITTEEKTLYERNAKNLLTLWGDKDCPLHEYACRQWSGLITDFYKPRWELFFTGVLKAMRSGHEFNLDDFTKLINQWEWEWVNKRKDYPITTKGDAIAIIKDLYNKYRPIVSTVNY
jgi:alpha-N-acetylglucosaminidase